MSGQASLWQKVICTKWLDLLFYRWVQPIKWPHLQRSQVVDLDGSKNKDILWMQSGLCNYNFSYIYYTDWQIAVCDLGHSSPG